MAWEEGDQAKHDLACERRMEKCMKDLSRELKEWCSREICLATKGGKIWRKWMRPIVMLLLAAALAGHFMPDTSSSQDHANNEVKQELRLEVIEKAYIEMKGKVDSTEKTVNDMKIQQAIQTQILRGLAGKHGVEVEEPKIHHGN